MKQFLRTLLIGLGAFLVVRFFLLVVYAGNAPKLAAIKTAMIPVQLTGIGLGLALQPNKWHTAVDIVKDEWQGSDHLKLRQRAMIAVPILTRWAELVDVEEPQIFTAVDAANADKA